MKQRTAILKSLVILVVLLSASCRYDEFISIGSNGSDNLADNTEVSGLLQDLSLNDGSLDNIIDGASCFSVVLPVTVVANGTEVTVNTTDDYAVIEAIFDASLDDVDSLVIQFPISIRSSDFTEFAVSDQNELNAFANACGAENSYDDDIECADIKYPITGTLYNSVTERFDAISLTSDHQLFEFIKELKNDDIALIDFPIVVVLYDGSEIQVGNLQELGTILENAKDLCDEDDDNDYNDDDCNDCSQEQLQSILESCSGWYVDRLEIGDDRFEDSYSGYAFTFNSDGSAVTSNGNALYAGTWSSNGTSNGMLVSIEFQQLTHFNALWQLHEVQDGSGATVDLRNGEDRLRFKSNCAQGTGSGDGGSDGTSGTGTLDAIVTQGSWKVGTYIKDNTDGTADYNGYTFTFMTDGSLTSVGNGGTVVGKWSSAKEGLELTLDLGSDDPLKELNNTWDVASANENQIDLEDVSGGGERVDRLILSKL